MSVHDHRVLLVGFFAESIDVVVTPSLSSLSMCRMPRHRSFSKWYISAHVSLVNPAEMCVALKCARVFQTTILMLCDLNKRGVDGLITTKTPLCASIQPNDTDDPLLPYKYKARLLSKKPSEQNENGIHEDHLELSRRDGSILKSPGTPYVRSLFPSKYNSVLSAYAMDTSRVVDPPNPPPAFFWYSEKI